MTGAEPPWPPLIVAANIPRAVRWRDALLTLAAWAAFVLLLDHEFVLSLGALKLLGLGGAHVRVDWPSYLARLAPFLLVSAVLPLALVFFSIRTLRRRTRALRLPAPAPLESAEQALGAGLDERALVIARGHRIVVVHNDSGGLRIDAKGGG
ncbi:MAG TPA: PgaD family protein [Chloroflexota bacterium]|jgi:poly-beta-1,6-N-acetyl-D-glucosamine biosynthesis protein PgaD